jgi:prevent-host-death family protein
VATAVSRSTLNALDFASKGGILTKMTIRSEIGGSELADLVKQVQAGNDVLLTQGDKPVARLVPAHDAKTASASPLRVRSFKGHRILTPVIKQEELADEMFKRQ